MRISTRQIVLLALASCVSCGADEAWIEERLRSAQIAYQQQDLDAAHAAALEVIDRAPDEASARMLAARIAFYRKQPEAAEEHCQAILDEQPEHYGALLWLARILSAKPERHAEALEYADRALAVHARGPELWYLKGFLHEKQNQIAEAIAAYQAGTRSAQQLGLIHDRLARLYTSAEIPRKAEYHATRAKFHSESP